MVALPRARGGSLNETPGAGERARRPTSKCQVFPIAGEETAKRAIIMLGEKGGLNMVRHIYPLLAEGLVALI